MIKVVLAKVVLRQIRDISELNMRDIAWAQEADIHLSGLFPRLALFKSLRLRIFDCVSTKYRFVLDLGGGGDANVVPLMLRMSKRAHVLLVAGPTLGNFGLCVTSAGGWPIRMVGVRPPMDHHIP